jgi:ABC-type Mn2+/Zn2+ transport system permease subunit
MHALVEPWRHAFMQRALLEVVLLGIAGGPLGCWVVLYRLSYSAESLAHALFPGIVVAALAGTSLVAGGAVGVAIAAIAIALVARVPSIGADTGVAVVVTTLFAVGVVLALAPATPPGLESLLFGDLLGVTRGDLALGATLAVAVLAALAILHRLLLVAGFDRGNARAFGAHPLAADLALLALGAATILIGVQALGNLLVVAIVVAPAAAARTLAQRVVTMLGVAAAIAVAAGIGGLYLSYYADTAAGASVAAIAAGAYALAALAAFRPTR